MNTLNLRIKYRPLRIGWCLVSNDISALRNAFQFSHTMWGGRFNPVIPVDKSDLAIQLVKLFRVDMLFPVSKDKKVAKFIEQFAYLPNPFFESDLFIKWGSGEFFAQILDLYHPIRHLYERHIKNNPSPAFKATLYEWQEEDPLSNVFLATFGGFPPKEQTGTSYSGGIEKYLAAEKVDLTALEKVPQDSFRKKTPNWISCLDLNNRSFFINPWTTPGFYFGDATRFDDLLHYWNLRSANIELLFYDPAFGDRLDALKSKYLTALQQRPRRHDPPEAHATVWNDRKNKKMDLAGFGKGITKNTVDLAIWNGFNVKVPIVCFDDKAVLATVGTSSGKTNVSFSLPEKPCFKDSRHISQHLMASINCGIGLYGNEQETLALPFLPHLNEFYGRECYFRWNKARVEPDGIGIIIDAWQEDLTLSAIKVTSLISKVFNIVGIRSQPSRPGLIALRLIQQLGGLQGCRVFKIWGVRELIQKYRPDQSFTRSAAIQIIGQLDPKTGKPNFSDYEKLVIEYRARRSKQKPEDALAFLVKHGVFRVGLKLVCQNCLLDFWIPLDDVRTKTECEFCGNEFDITPQLRDRDWRYRRSGLFGKENKQEGAIPVVLTLQQMHTIFSTGNMLYTTSMELNPESASIQKCETDFVILNRNKIDNKVHMAIGECKNHQEITEEDVSKLRVVAESLEDIGVHVFIIFSKLSSFSPDELKRCAKVNGKYRRRLILFTPRELEPYFLYEKTSKEFDIDMYVHSFDNMVEVTQKVFFAKRIKVPQSNQEA